MRNLWLALSDKRRGVLAALLAFGIYSSMDALMKQLGGRYPISQNIFINVSFAFILYLVLAWRVGELTTVFSSPRRALYLLRGILGAVTGLCVFYAFNHLPMADVYTVIFAAPLLIAILAGFFLGEKTRADQWLAIIIGFVGVALALQGQRGDDGGQFNWLASLAVLGAACSYAIVAIMMRRNTQTDSMYTNLILPCLSSLPIMLAALLLVEWSAANWPNPWDWALLLLVGMMNAAGTFCILYAFRHANASLVAPTQYTQFLWGSFYGWLIWGDQLGIMTLVGALIVVAAGLYLYKKH